MRPLLRLSLVTLFVFIYSAGRVSPLAACTPTPVGLAPETLAQRVGAADIILEGVVLSVLKDPFTTQTAAIQVLKYLKGDGPEQVTMTNFGGSDMCLTTVDPGEHLVFYATGSPAAALRAYYSSAGRAIASPSDELIAEIAALTGQSPIVFQSAADFAQTQTASPATAPLDPTRLTQTRLAEQTTAAPSVTPGPFAQQPVLNQQFTEVWATVEAAAVLYPNDPTRQSMVQTEVYPTLEALYTAHALSATPTLVPFQPSPPPAPSSGPVAVDIIRLLGIGVVIGLSLGVLGGTLVGLWLSRWRE